MVSISIKYYASLSIDNDVQGLLDKGLVVSVAAGNDNDDACTISPQRVKDVSINILMKGYTLEFYFFNLLFYTFDGQCEVMVMLLLRV